MLSIFVSTVLLHAFLVHNHVVLLPQFLKLYFVIWVYFVIFSSNTSFFFYSPLLCIFLLFQFIYFFLQVTASAWINDLRNQIERTRILSTVYRSASALGSRLPSIASARARVAGAGAILRPVSNGTQVPSVCAIYKLLTSIVAWFRWPTFGIEYHMKLFLYI